MSCPVHDSDAGNSKSSVYYFDPDYLATGTGGLYLCNYAYEDNSYYVDFDSSLYLNGIYITSRSGTLAPGEHNWTHYSYSLGNMYKLVGYGNHTFNYGNDIPVTLNPARVFLFHGAASNEADKYDEYSMSGITLSCEKDGFQTLTAKDGGLASGLTISEGCSARFHEGATAAGVSIKQGGSLTMDEKSILKGNVSIDKGGSVQIAKDSVLQANISVTGQLSVGGKVNAAGANITLNVKDHSPENAYMISGTGNLSNISSCTITVKADQKKGEYCLASGLNVSSIKGTAWENISFTVDGVSLQEQYKGQYTFTWDDKEKSYSYIKYEDNIYYLDAPNTGDSTGNLTLAVEDTEIPDQVLEFLARNDNACSVYKRHKEGEILTVEYDDKKYYFRVDCVVEDNTGFDAMGLIRVTSKDPDKARNIGQTVVVCRGSETDKENGKHLDWQDDFNIAGVGVGQFNGNGASQLKNWLTKRTEDEVYFTGHSLGGALAQRFAVYYNSQANSEIGGLVTFNAPGGADTAMGGVVEIDADKVHHYIVDGDMISMVGNGFVTGDKESDSWYTIYTDNDVFEGTLLGMSLNNLSGYLLNRHTQTLTSAGKTSETGDISELANPNFSYIGTPDNFNANYARFILSLATKYGDDISDYIGSDVTEWKLAEDKEEWDWLYDTYEGYIEELVADIDTANNLTTRNKAEKFRVTVDYEVFVDIVLSPANALFDEDEEEKAGIILGNKDLVSTDGSRAGHTIRTLEYSGDADDLPDLLYDFNEAEFITIKHLALEDDTLFTSNDHNNNVKYARKVSVEKNENTWICFSLPFSYSNFLELKSIMTESGLTVSQVNYIIAGNKIIVLDDPSTTYTFNFQRDESITQTTAQIYVSETNISLLTETIQLELSDIDASLTAGGSNDFIWVDVITDSMTSAIRVKLLETAFEGVFTGEFSLLEKDGIAPDVTISCYDTLTISYNDTKNKDGNTETVISTCTAAPLKLDIDISDQGLPEGYTGEFKSLDWLELQINISQSSAAGDHILIKNAESDLPVITLYDSLYDITYQAELDNYYYIDGKIYKLSLKDNNLVVSVDLSPRILTWESFSADDSYCVEFSTDDFSSIFSYTVNSNQLQLFNLTNGFYQYRVKAADQDTWEIEGNIVIVSTQVGNSWVSAQDNIQDVFFVSVSNVWESGYRAEHSGMLNGWTGTKERVLLTGKNRISDIFQGSTDANVLLLTDDENGDALFIDDIFTDLPSELSVQQSRIAMIDEIRAGAGDDIIDLTSQRFAWDNGGVTVLGGNGNDTIWGNNGTNILFGDAGHDRLIGGSSSDVLVGGAGNDTMHGGGGEDIFIFGKNCGYDVVEQLEDGIVILWFESGSYDKWDAATLTYRDKSNIVRVAGCSQENIFIVFGNELGESYFNDYANIGAFSNAASEKIFEDKNSGMLA